MAYESIKLNAPTLLLAATQADLDTPGTATAAECQTNSAAIVATGKSTATPATGCKPETQSAGPSSWAINVTWIQDWNNPDGVSQFAYDHDGETVWYRLLAGDDYPGLGWEGQCDIVAGQAGGNFGDGTEVNATATWPAKGKPTILRAVGP